MNLRRICDVLHIKDITKEVQVSCRTAFYDFGTEGVTMWKLDGSDDRDFITTAKDISLRYHKYKSRKEADKEITTASKAISVLKESQPHRFCVVDKSGRYKIITDPRLKLTII